VSFGNPWLLLGTLAALIPLLVHLFDRRRPRQVPFAALSFVLRSQRRTARRLKLRRLLLYALRTLLLLAVPLALTRPELGRPTAAVQTRGLAATAVVLDTSLALRWKDGSAPLFEEARREAKAALRELSPEEPATLVPCTRNPAPVARPSFDRARLLSQVDDVQVGYEAVDLNRCLEVAAHALDEATVPGRRLVVVSAFTLGGLHLEAPPPVAAGPRGEKVKPEVVLRPVAPGKALPNQALVEVRAEAAPQLGPRAWQFTYTVRNFSQEAKRDVELRLLVNGETVAKGFLDIAPGGTAQKTLAHRFSQGGQVVVTGALEPDALAEDDSRALVLAVPRELRALVVDGAPSAQKYKDAAFFLEAALSAPGSPVRAVVRDAEAARREALSAFDVVLLLDVEAPSPEWAKALEDFVEAGGGLFVSMGGHVEPEAWSAAAKRLLPRPLRVVKTAVEPGQGDAAARAARLQQVSTSHPIFAPFAGRAREGLLSTRFSRYLLFEGDSPGASSEVLATLDDGAPLLIAARKGKGRVLEYASTLDPSWSDLPIRTGFLPLAQRLTAWLTGTLDEREEVRARVGEAVTLTPEAGQVVASARAPGGAEVLLTAQPPGARFVSGPLPEPGPYAVLDAKGQPVPALAFAATLDPAASDLARHDVDALSGWFGEEVVRSGGSSPADRRAPLWTWLLVTAALAFFLEGVVLRV
jgi:Aerotolerance regulator N-terminal